MELERKIYQELLEWKSRSQGKSALLIEGARRVGKSTIAEKFAREQYDDYIKLDFALEGPDIRRNFEENIGQMDVFFRNLFILKGKELPRRKSLLIFDEVQLFPLARQAIKYLVQDGRYDYLETGSLISIKRNVKDILIPSEEEKIKMYPLDFEEFLWAIGNRVTIPAIWDAFYRQIALGDPIHRKIMEQFRTYMAVGGMPQAVVAFAEGNSYQRIDTVKRGILQLYEDDLHKNDELYGEKASLVFKTIPKQMTDHQSHYMFSEIDKNARYKNYVDSVEFIADSMIANRCANVSMPDVLLSQYADNRNFKLYMSDTGLLVSQLLKSGDGSNEIYRALIYDKLDANLGAVMENMVAQMLVTNHHELYFHEYEYKPEDSKKEKKYEIDFLIARNQRVCPIEVKSSGYKNHKSFDYFIKKYPIRIPERFILYTKDLRQDEGVTFLPLYMAMCL
ncbi:MAG: ATP-binding protein [Clostridia bacterium]|nr:ATP-binding protein [Clostridia bacterium]